MNEAEKRLAALESNHGLLAKDVSQINKTLSKIEITLEKQNEILNKFLVIENRVESNEKAIEKLEEGKNKVLWYIAMTFISSLVALVFSQSK